MTSYWKAALLQLLFNDLPSTNALMLINWCDSLGVDVNIWNIHKLFFLLKSIDKFARLGGFDEMGKEAFDRLSWHYGSIRNPESSQLHRALHYLEK